MATNLFTNGNESKTLATRMATNLLTNGDKFENEWQQKQIFLPICLTCI